MIEQHRPEDLSDIARATCGVMVRETGGVYILKAEISLLLPPAERHVTSEAPTLAEAADALRAELRRRDVSI